MNAIDTIPDNIDDYIARFPKETQELLELLRSTIKKAAPEASETISYQMPAFKLHGNLVYFAAYNNHIGFYPGAACIDLFKDEFKGFKTSKGTIQFPMNKPIPLDIITKIVKYRIFENTERAEAKKKKK